MQAHTRLSVEPELETIDATDILKAGKRLCEAPRLQIGRKGWIRKHLIISTLRQQAVHDFHRQSVIVCWHGWSRRLSIDSWCLRVQR